MTVGGFPGRKRGGTARLARRVAVRAMMSVAFLSVALAPAASPGRRTRGPFARPVASASGPRSIGAPVAAGLLPA